MDAPSQSNQMQALVGALGSVIGYLGSEVAEKVLFERLMWPQRYYNDLTFSIFLKQGFLMTMGGPLHAAALATLDVFRDSGLYKGTRRGHMLGTAFLPSTNVTNFLRTDSDSRGIAKQSRNGFWVQVLKNIKDVPVKEHVPRIDRQPTNDLMHVRTRQPVHHLRFRLVSDIEPPGEHVICISEERTTLNVVLGIFLSELSAVISAVVAGARMRDWWLVPYLCIPLILKLLSVLVNVRRSGLESYLELQRSGSLSDSVVIEVQNPNHGFAVLEGPEPVIRQFFRHYGHPKRDTCGDRVREVFSILLIYLFVLIFPVGLVANLWMSTEVQYLWLAYQLYAILAMHIVRIFGWEGCGRTEERVAGHLRDKMEVWLYSTGGCTVGVNLRTTYVDQIKAGETMVQEIVRKHRPHDVLKSHATV
ncbi:uncharacterized protein LY89DRAFT_692557 [Mollisia scopiformis]|uniref:Uncharacterized protein n=1 Tax=Mollisia scopiformis TaxID=149040 RepID=A0A132B1P4_MOLSC|nr:uncharacterized protein LY89DRAFT_692557 [Mollisia scopiformis]KUJ06308.1 hypothetical protein LY89DRAFT_692557 [Mollisia scopiformis]